MGAAFLFYYIEFLKIKTVASLFFLYLSREKILADFSKQYQELKHTIKVAY